MGQERQVERAKNSKSDLLAKLPLRLKSYRKFLPSDWRIVVLIDEDRQDCIALKDVLEDAAMEAGLITRSRAQGGSRFQVLNRIIVEKLEAWFFGDVQAIHQAYEKILITLATKSAYRDPDAIKGGTWEVMERELQKAGYFKGGLAKIKVARAISANMEPSRNRSRCFQVFRKGLMSIARGI